METTTRQRKKKSYANKPTITSSIIRNNNKISEMKIKKVVRSLGNTGYISLPGELIGKYVEIYYKEDSQ